MSTALFPPAERTESEAANFLCDTGHTRVAHARFRAKREQMKRFQGLLADVKAIIWP